MGSSGGRRGRRGARASRPGRDRPAVAVGMRRSRLRARSRPAATSPRKGRVVASVARWREIRREAEALAGGCLNPWCRRRVRLDLHHVVKRSAGGADEIWNIVPLCRRCHNATDLPAGSRGSIQIRRNAALPELVGFIVWLGDEECGVHDYVQWPRVKEETPMTLDEQRLQSRERASRRFPGDHETSGRPDPARAVRRTAARGLALPLR